MSSTFTRFAALGRLLAVGIVALGLAACQDGGAIPKDIRPVSPKLVSKMQSLGMSETSPILIRIYKEESKLEVWKEKRSGQYALLKTYDICKWSGVLGPKIKEGDRQAPEGFYTVTPAAMNPKSSYYLSFNIGYPNAFDQSLGRTGTHLMVHGACSSSGCYSMTDADAGELFALARDAFKGGQRSFQIQAYPFRMTAENMAKHRDNPNVQFWQMLKVGSDNFEVTLKPPKVDVCGQRYVFNAESTRPFVPTAKCPAYTVPDPIAQAVAAKEASDQQKFAAAVAAADSKALALAEQQKKAEQQAAAKAAAEAAQAEQPPLIARIFGGLGKKNQPAAPAASSAPVVADPATTGATTAAQPISATTPAPKAKPAPKPAVEASAAPAKPAAAKPPATASATAPATTSVPTPAPTKTASAAPAASPVAKVPPAPAAAAMEPLPTSAPAPQPVTTAAAAPKRDFFWASE